MHRLWVGIGYQKGISAPEIEQVITQVFRDFDLDLSLVCGLGTIDRKAHDPEIGQVCRTRGWQLHFYAAVALSIVPVPHPTNISQLDTPSVAEAAALLAAGHNGQLVVTKQICYQTSKALTIAVAQADLIS